MLKRILAVFTAVFVAASSFAACSTGSGKANGNGHFNIVTTIFPEYDWVMNVLGDNPAGADVTLLLDGSADLHSYQPSAADIMKISTCDMLVYVGGQSGSWIDDALKQKTNPDMIVINLMDTLGDSLKEEELVEGMQGEEEEETDGDIEYDEHTWLSLRNAAKLVNAISEGLQKADPANASGYASNASSYINKLNDLDAEYQAVVNSAARKTVLFGDRFPFRYLTDDYGLEYYAAFVGCSAESEASFATITFLSQKIDQLSLPVVLTIEGDNHRIAETIIENTKTKDQKILIMDSMQSISKKDIENGTTYLSVMENNLEVLKEALG